MVPKNAHPRPKWKVAFDFPFIFNKKSAIMEKKQAGISEPTVKSVK